MRIYENNIIERLDINFEPQSIQRVLWVSPESELLIVVNINNQKKMELPHSVNYSEIVNEISEGMARIIDYEPDLRLISPEFDYLNKNKLSRDNNWNVIKDIVVKEPDIYLPELRGEMIKEAIEYSGRSKKEIYRLLKRYWFYGKTKNALLRNYFECGQSENPRKYSKKPGPKSKDSNNFIVTEKDKKIFEKAIEKFHIKQKMNLTVTHQHMCEESYNSGYYRKHGVLVPMVEPEKAPTMRQFKNWYDNNYSFAKKYSNKHGKRKAEMDVRPLQGDATERAQGIGYLYEIDSTPADIILVAEDRKSIIGTPTLYIVKDVFSRMVVGFHASLSPASTIEQMVALENAAINKVEFCRQYNIEIEECDWPCINLPKFLDGDRGELKSKWGENLTNIKVQVNNAPSYRGDLKPFVERHFGLTNDEIRELLFKVGAKPSRAKERGDLDPERNAALTIYEFTQFMIIQIITYNKSALNKDYIVTREMFEDKVELSPLEVWNWGAERNHLHEERRDLLRYNLLPKEFSRVTRFGIKFSNMFYTCEYGLKAGWFEEERIDGQKQIEIGYDPRNVSSIFLRLRNGEIKQCFLTPKYEEYEGLHLEDVKAIMNYKKKAIRKKEKEETQYKAELHAFTKQMSEDAIKKTKEVTSDVSFYERKKDKRSNRKAEARNLGSQTAWTTVNHESEDIEKTTDVIPFPKSQTTTTFDEKQGIHSLFETKNKERRRNREPLE